jgi:hypothetical protein
VIHARSIAYNPKNSAHREKLPVDLAARFGYNELRGGLPSLAISHALRTRLTNVVKVLFEEEHPMVEDRIVAQTWLFQPRDDRDQARDLTFENDLAALLGEEDLDDAAQWRLANALELRILTRKDRPSTRQLARFWRIRAQQYVQREQLHQAFEAYTLCDHNIPLDETMTRLYIHSLLVHISLQQGHYIQSLMSSYTVTAAIRALAPQFIEAQQAESALTASEDLLALDDEQRNWEGSTFAYP